LNFVKDLFGIRVIPAFISVRSLGHGYVDGIQMKVCL
jgi:hypothetical protein